MDLGTKYQRFRSGHIWCESKSCDDLTRLPESISFRLFQHIPSRIFLLDTFRKGTSPSEPFSALLPSVDVPLELPPELDVIERLYKVLQPIGRADGIKRSYINFCRFLSEILGTSCLSFAGDDAELDFVCQAVNNKLVFLRTACSDVTVEFSEGRAAIEPWRMPRRDYLDIYSILGDTESTRRALSDIEIRKPIRWPALGQQMNIMKAWKDFTMAPPSIVGLGKQPKPTRINLDDFQLLTQRMIAPNES